MRETPIQLYKRSYLHQKLFAYGEHIKGSSLAVKSFILKCQSQQMAHRKRKKKKDESFGIFIQKFLNQVVANL